MGGQRNGKRKNTEYLNDWHKSSYAEDTSFRSAYEILRKLPDYEALSQPENLNLKAVFDMLVPHFGGSGKIASFAVRENWLDKDKQSSFAHRIYNWTKGSCDPRHADVLLALRCLEKMSNLWEPEKNLDLQKPCEQLNHAIIDKFGNTYQDKVGTLQVSLKLLFGKNGILGNPRILLQWAAERGHLPSDITMPELAIQIEYWKQNQKFKLDARKIDLLINLVRIVVVEELPKRAPQNYKNIKGIKEALENMGPGFEPLS